MTTYVSSPDWEKLMEEARSVLKRFDDLRYDLRDYERRRDEVVRMYSTGQISREVFDSLMGELKQKMLPLVREYFQLKGRLRELEAQLRLATTRLSVEARASESSLYRASFEREQQIRSLLNRVGGVLESVQNALKNVSVERELRMLDVLLDVLTGDELKAWEGAIEEVIEGWGRARFTYASRIEELERKIEALNDAMKELEVRFAVGELDRGEYEVKRSALEREVGELQAQLEDLQGKLEDLDFIAARCRELLSRVRAG